MNTEYFKLNGERGADDEVFSRCGRIIREGGLVAFPTETVYGLGASAFSAESAKKIFEAKGRPGDNPLIVHAAYPEDAERFAYTNSLYYRLAERFMPGPLTVILPKKDIIPYEVTGGLPSVGIRCPAHMAAHRLILSAGVPIAAPSANLSGSPSPTLGEHVRRDLDGRCDAIIDGGSSDFGLESTVISISDKGDDSVVILRPGAVTREDLLEVASAVTLSVAVTDPSLAGERPESPGMKYRHYAPKCRFVLVDASDGDFFDYVNSASENERTSGAIVCDSEAGYLKNCRPYSYGRKGDARELCHSLFAIFRKADDDGIKELYARLPEKSGWSLALYNRMIRAAGNKIITPGEISVGGAKHER